MGGGGCRLVRIGLLGPLGEGVSVGMVCLLDTSLEKMGVLPNSLQKEEEEVVALQSDSGYPKLFFYSYPPDLIPCSLLCCVLQDLGWHQLSAVQWWSCPAEPNVYILQPSSSSSSLGIPHEE